MTVSTRLVRAKTSATPGGRPPGWDEEFTRGQTVVGLVIAVLLTLLRPWTSHLAQGNPSGLLIDLVALGYLGLVLRQSWRGARTRVRAIALWSSIAVAGAFVGSEVVGGMLGSVTQGVLGLGHVTNLNNQVIEARTLASPGATALMLLFGVVISPVMEELVFRGALFRALARLNGPLSHAVTALAFALFHIMVGLWHGHADQWVFAYGYALFSLALTLTYARCRNLLPGIVAHMLLNAIGFAVMILR